MARLTYHKMQPIATVIGAYAHLNDAQPVVVFDVLVVGGAESARESAFRSVLSGSASLGGSGACAVELT